MINEQFSLMQLVMAVLSSGVFSSFLTHLSSRKVNKATVDETVRKTLGEVIDDLRNQIAFLQEQIVSALTREKEYLALLAQGNGENQSLRAELSACQLNGRRLESQKDKFERKLITYEALAKRSENHTKA